MEYTTAAGRKSHLKIAKSSKEFENQLGFLDSMYGWQEAHTCNHQDQELLQAQQLEQDHLPAHQSERIYMLTLFINFQCNNWRIVTWNSATIQWVLSSELDVGSFVWSAQLSLS